MKLYSRLGLLGLYLMGAMAVPAVVMAPSTVLADDDSDGDGGDDDSGGDEGGDEGGDSGGDSGGD